MARKKRGENRTFLPLPDEVNPADELCVVVHVPNSAGHRQAFLGQMWQLTRWTSWERDDARTGRLAAARWATEFERLVTTMYDGCEQCEDAPECKDYPLSSAFIQYTPNDPFRTPNFAPSPYALPPFYRNPLIPIPGVKPTDVMVNGAAFLPTPGAPSLIEFIGEILFGVGLPTITIKVSGAGQLEVEFVTIPQGGLALILTDTIAQPPQVIDLNRWSLIDAASIQAIIDLIVDSEFDLVDRFVEEFNFTEPGEHEVKIIFIPQIGGEVLYGFGGGIGRVTLCGLTGTVTGGDIVQLRVTSDCRLQVSYDGGQNWVDVEGWQQFGVSCFTGPAGPPGAPGAAGPAGPPGAPGQDGQDGQDGQNADDSEAIESVRCRYSDSWYKAIKDLVINTIQEAIALKSANAPLVDFQDFVEGLWQERFQPFGGLPVPAVTALRFAAENLYDLPAGNGQIVQMNADFQEDMITAAYNALSNQPFVMAQGNYDDWKEAIDLLYVPANVMSSIVAFWVVPYEFSPGSFLRLVHDHYVANTRINCAALAGDVLQWASQATNIDEAWPIFNRVESISLTTAEPLAAPLTVNVEIDLAGADTFVSLTPASVTFPAGSVGFAQRDVSLTIENGCDIRAEKSVELRLVPAGGSVAVTGVNPKRFIQQGFTTPFITTWDFAAAAGGWVGGSGNKRMTWVSGLGWRATSPNFNCIELLLGAVASCDRIITDITIEGFNAWSTPRELNIEVYSTDLSNFWTQTIPLPAGDFSVFYSVPSEAGPIIRIRSFWPGGADLESFCGTAPSAPFNQPSRISRIVVEGEGRPYPT